MQVGAVASEELVRLYRQEDIEIAGGPPRRPASPSPASLIRPPSSMPAGMLTDSERLPYAPWRNISGTDPGSSARAAGLWTCASIEEPWCRTDTARSLAHRESRATCRAMPGQALVAEIDAGTWIAVLPVKASSGVISIL